jgi:hypothetical protein
VAAKENLTITQVFAARGKAETLEAARVALIRRIQQARREKGLERAVEHPLLSELAARHIDELEGEPDPRTLRTVGERISQETADAKDEAIRGVLVAAQLLPESQSFEPPEALRTRPGVRFGLAVAKAKQDNGRPMLRLLLLVSH